MASMIQRGLGDLSVLPQLLPLDGQQRPQSIAVCQFGHIRTSLDNIWVADMYD